MSQISVSRLFQVTLTILLCASFSGCRTTKQLNSERSTVREQQEIMENIKTECSQETQTQVKTLAETTITESLDTVMQVFPVVDGKVSKDPVPVHVKQKRITQRKEFSDQKEQQKQHVNVASEKKEQQSKQSETRKTEKQVQKNSFPWWLIFVLALAFILVVIWKIRSRYR